MEELDPRRYLIRYRGTQVDFFRFPGNYGDSLIWHGTKELLRSCEIQTRDVSIESPRNSRLLIDGGGNLVDYYSDVRDFLMKKSLSYDEIIILPHTINGEEQIAALNRIRGRLVVFCREQTSAQYVKQRLRRGEIYLWHDCAFYNNFSISSTGNGVLNAFRTDCESVIGKCPTDNVDLSCNGWATKPLKELIDCLMQFQDINTDRLHIAICGVLLKKNVRLFANSYYKNRAVYDYSLKRFPNIRFAEHPNG